MAGILGSGGMGGLSRRGILLSRLHDEVRLGRQISHPNVCRVYDIGEADDAHFVAMEFVDGEDLSRLLPASAAWPTTRRSTWPAESRRA